jgi:hypothetical protein
MKRDDPTVATARITARQTIIVAAITGVVSIVTTLGATGELFPRRSATSSSGSAAAESRPAVLEAPAFGFRGRRMGSSLEDCRRKAEEAFAEARFDGAQFLGHFGWGYRGTNTGVVWCHFDVDQVIFIAAGKEIAGVEETLELLDRTY